MSNMTYRLMHELIRSKTYLIKARSFMPITVKPYFDDQLVVMDELIREAKEALRKQSYKV